MAFDQSQFFQVFFEETREHLATMEELLLELDIDTPDSEDLAAIFRAAHSMKGGAGTFGFKEMTDVAHVFESVLDRVRKKTLSLSPEMMDLFLETSDVLKGFLSSYQEGSKIDPQMGFEVTEKLKAYLDTAVPAVPSKGQANEASPSEQQSPDEGGQAATVEEDPGYGFFDEVGLGKGEEEKSKLEDEQGFGFFDDPPAEGESSTEEVTSEKKTASKEKPSRSSKGRRASDYADESDIPIPTGRRESDKVVLAKQRIEKTTSLRIDVKKIDQLFNQVGEIVITQAMLAQMASKLDPAVFENLQTGLEELERNTRNLQESVMEIRMVPCKTVFSRFPRLIRDMQRKYNKEVKLLMEGEETEVDKGFVEKLADPLTHLIRNSFDHGIESPEARVAAGKPAEGIITIRASHQGGSVVIEVSDDGKGLSREKILTKAREKEMPLKDDMSDEEVWQLIFASGLSTIEKVSDLSGRGVGMDVVKKNVTAMGGVVHVESQAGEGSRVTIKLPLTLAIIEGMVIRVGKETYIFPLISIIESIRPKATQVNNVLGKGELVELRGEYVPIFRLYDLFGSTPEMTDPSEAVLVIVEHGGKRLAVMVDELLGQQQVVIKSLEQNFKKVDGISGATILGDGEVAFILDVSAFMQFSKNKEKALAA
ncbi:chemotaxis protein CheA [Nitrospira defluvii]|nr:chemotaxis protein CheA [Nitrospira defluvii]